ncbi:MAG TPA: TonB-dependent receptor [Sphingomicrobium sp.]|nr:TonB-dependent receptor [Sphingomicrobium sp.]
MEHKGQAPPFFSRKRRIGAAILLAGVAIPAQADSAADLADSAQPAARPQHPDIIITGQALIRDVRPEYELDETGIASFGASTVDELLAEILGQLDEDDLPLILINGERVTDLSDIAGYPVEALRNVTVLPRGSAVRAGGTTGQRVVSLTLQRTMRAVTATLAPRIATEGDWSAMRGESLLTYIQGSTRANLAFRYRGEGNLLESDRDIIQPAPRLPFATGGNVIAHPVFGGEIDPLLSAAAGMPVTVAPVPTRANPTLADFASAANRQNMTDMGDFRTLRPRLRNYDVNGTFSTRLAPWLTSNFGLRMNRNTSLSLRGLPTGLFVLSEDNPASPFSRDVGLTFLGAEPLQSHVRRDTYEARAMLNGRHGSWSSNFTARHAESRDLFRSQRQASSSAIALGNDINPFARDLSDMIALRSDESRGRSISDNAQLSFTGPAFSLPAGEVRATVEGRVAWNRTRSQSSFSVPSERRTRRDEQAVRAAVEVPIASRANDVLPQIGELNMTGEIGRTHYSDAGSLDRIGAGLIWDPTPAFQLRGSVEKVERAASVQILGSPIVETPDVRLFDPLRGETVDVVQITGGNPDIDPEDVRTLRVGAELRPLPRMNLVLNAEYTDTDARNFISSLPPTSLPVMLAFPDRYIRDSSGNLTTVDLRPVNFDSHREKRLRWGFRIRPRLSSGSLSGPGFAAGPSDGESGEESAPSPQPDRPARAGVRPATFAEFTANHNIVFAERIVIRPGLDDVDLLGGGALGLGGGRVRHQLDGTAALTSGGLGVRLSANWRGRSSLDANIGGVSDTIRFDPLFVVNLRAFADAARIVPQWQWARGTRFSLNLLNVTNDRQRVRNSAGETPLQYQPGYRDPLGRTIEFEIRRMFR